MSLLMGGDADPEDAGFFFVDFFVDNWDDNYFIDCKIFLTIITYVMRKNITLTNAICSLLENKHQV